MNVWAKKSLGQHFLASPEYCRKIAHFAQIDPEDTVVEIGPGTGQLTKILVPLARRVIAIEFDRDLVQYLKDHGPKTDRLTLIQADVLTFNWSTIVGKNRFKVIGNLPYNISTQILQKMIEIKGWFQSCTFLVQKEVAQRILSGPNSKDYGFFSLLIEYHFQRTEGFDVPPGVFTPKPKVTSQVVQLIPRRPLYPVPDYPTFLALLKNAFQQRRKTLWNNLRRNQEPKDISRAFEACGIGLQARPQEVTLEQYACLGRML